MSDRSDELLFAWLNQRVERLTTFSARHRPLTDLVLALFAAALSIAGLMAQHRISPQLLVFCAALTAPLLLRHRSPALCFAGVALAAFLQWLLSGPQLADVSVLIALYSVCEESGPGTMAAALATAEVGAILVALQWEPSVRLKYWVGLTGLAVAAGALGIMIRQRRALLESLRERAARLERERDQQVQLGAAAERARIAREMHDVVSHNLTVMIALADGATYALDASPDRAAAAIERVSATGRQALLEMRRLLGVLRDDTVTELLEPQPGLERLDELLARVGAAGIPVNVDLDGDPQALAPGVQLAVFRVAQEALTNTLKHAARPTTARLALHCHAGEVELDVTNTGEASASGAAFAAPANGGGRGLRGMRERAAAYGGDLEVGPTDDGGWRVHLRLHSEAVA
jgi:signal transduction histidine kinase